MSWRASELLAVGLAGCGGHRFAAQADPLLNPALAGCTWTEHFASSVRTDRWNEDGRLVSEDVEDQDPAIPENSTTTERRWTWKGDCLREYREDVLVRFAPTPESAPAEHTTWHEESSQCDRRGNVVRTESLYGNDQGVGDPVVTTFDLRYDDEDRPVRQETDTQDDGTVDWIDTWEWDGDRVIAHDGEPTEPLPVGGAVHDEWTWERDRLVGLRSEGLTDVAWTWTYEHRRLATETGVTGEYESFVRWVYDGGPFPIGTDDEAGAALTAIVVTCD